MVPELLKFGQEAMDASRPIIRPLWMLNPLDPILQQIDDQFLIGDQILVAPVLHRGSREVNLSSPNQLGSLQQKGLTFFLKISFQKGIPLGGAFN